MKIFDWKQREAFADYEIPAGRWRLSRKLGVEGCQGHARRPLNHTHVAQEINSHFLHLFIASYSLSCDFYIHYRLRAISDYNQAYSRLQTEA